MDEVYSRSVKVELHDVVNCRFGFRRLLGVVGVVILVSIIVTASIIAHYDYPPGLVSYTRTQV